MFHKILLELTNLWMLSTLAVGGGTSARADLGGG